MIVPGMVCSGSVNAFQQSSRRNVTVLLIELLADESVKAAYLGKKK